VSKPYSLPTVKVLEAVMVNETATVTLKVSQEHYLGYPIASADLRQTDPHLLVFPFHQLVGREGPRLVFETYQSELMIPVGGSTHFFCSWWTPQAMDAVRDKSAQWELLAYPDNGDHNHCLLTWETISAYTSEREGYHSRHGWITLKAYHDFIEQDLLRVRSHSRSIELAGGVNPTKDA